MTWKGFDVIRSEEVEPVGRAQIPIPKTFTLQLRDDHLGQPDVEVTWQVRDGKPECTAVTFTAAEQEVRTSWMCRVRLDGLLDSVIRWMMSGTISLEDDTGQLLNEDGAGGFQLEPGPVEAAAAVRTARKTKITDDLLREVADVYRANVDDKPTIAVAEHFGREHRTAALYVKKARDRGFLGAAMRGKAGEK
jgi:hypothetical protein